ncbi:DNA topoisomerase IV subunit A [Spiroplasma poulsonii]|uniref:DNA topoisomerase IV subunit A n=1 Tax=Spiroplasma poulsonii TaxID=2138 RepID=UPI000591FA5B|nr:DNA topoisomerase IV subunit A [Spiroplasma poulsonii]PWF96679.1 DNA topoisomerase 4 subunit A [Spiroplasma poulsonii]PWF97255.1 DNA topoisomerase 4 subunit A [Spiroplasma poulsonii]
MSNSEKTNELIYTLNDIMAERFGRYAKYIIQDRALPDVRDGLKPVQRRILFAMNELRLTFNSSYKKSARIVGEVIGKYHPHGDTSVYDAMVRLSQNWKVRYPLIDMHGNNGSIDGDPAAAMRYTETRLSEISSFLLQDLDKKTVAFAPNFDDSEQEPVVLPALFPNLLVNGSTGIAAGYATNIPPHNLHEIIDATIHFIKKPKSKITELIKYVKGPDFPTGGIIQGKNGILEAYRTGKGKIIIRSKIKNENNALVITEIPYEVVKQDLVKKIDDIKYNEPGLNIKEVRDETDREGLRIVVELGKQANFEIVRKFLLKNTNLQVSYNFNVVGIAKKQPLQLGLKEILTYYVEHQHEVVTNRSQFELARAEKRSEIVAGLIKTISILDAVITTIRHSKDRTDAINNLVAKFVFSKLQAESIVQLRLYRLTSTDILQLEAEQKELIATIADLKAILSDINKLNHVIIRQLELIKKRFHSPRRSIIEDEIEAIEIEKTETIIEKNLNIWISRDGYLKALENNQLVKLTTEEFKRKPGDLWIADFQANSLDKILLITSKGNYVIIPVYKIKSVRIKDIGEHVNTISELPGEEKIISAFLLNDFNKPEQYIMLATKNGMIKKTAVKDFEATRISKAIKAINLKGDDEVVASQLVDKHLYVVVTTVNGFIVKYKAKEIPALGLRTAGVKSINLRDDTVVGAGYCKEDTLVFITNLNAGKKITIKELPSSTRPVKGTRMFKVNKKVTEVVKWIFLAKQHDTLHMLNQQDEIMLFNTDKLNVHKLERSTDPLGVENIVDIVIPQYYNLKIIHSRKMVEHHSEKPAKSHLFHYDQKKQHHNVKPVDDITKTVNSTVNKSAPDQKSKEKTNSLNDSNNDDETDLVVKANLVLEPIESIIEPKEVGSAPIELVEIKVDLITNEIQKQQEKPSAELKITEPIQKHITTQKAKKKKRKVKQMPEAPLESVKKTTPIIVEEPLSSFSLKTFGKVKTTVDILLEKKELAKVQRALKEQAENNHPVENKPVQNVTQKAKPNLGKVVTTVETLIKDKKIKTSENKNFNKLSPTPPKKTRA